QSESPSLLNRSYADNDPRIGKAKSLVVVRFASDLLEIREVYAGVAADGKAPRRHAGAEPFDAGAVAVEDDIAVAGVALDSEELAKSDLGVAVLHGQGGDLAGEIVGRDALGLPWYFSRSMETRWLLHKENHDPLQKTIWRSGGNESAKGGCQGCVA